MLVLLHSKVTTTHEVPKGSSATYKPPTIPGGCRCSDANVGCTILIPAEPGKACRCIFKVGKWDQCEEAVAVACSDPASKYCKNPDSSKESCLLGGGNCRGY